MPNSTRTAGGPKATLVFGLRATGDAVARVLHGERRAESRRGGSHGSVVVSDDDLDRPDVAERARMLRGLGVDVVGVPADWATFLDAESVGLVVPSPGVRPDHPLIRSASVAEVPVRSEIDLAAERIGAPLVAISGTNGKTTVTEMITAMLRESGRRVACGGNIGTPLITLVHDDADVVVAEVSSFQLEFTTPAFAPRVAALLNIADDHLDWHGSRAAYEAAKAQLFAFQHVDDVLIVGDDDDARRVSVRSGRARLEVRDPGAGPLRCLDGTTIVDASELARSLPHDRVNVLAAAEAALAAGADIDAVRRVASSYRTQHHRVELVATIDGVEWYDDSKATNPHAAVRAIEAFDSVVLCAGGLNKGLDLTPIAGTVERIRAVVAFGAAADEIAEAFAGSRPVARAGSMDDVVDAAARYAEPGDVVLLSPACASFDAFRDYAARGDAFALAVRSRVGDPGQVTPVTAPRALPSIPAPPPPHTEVAR